MSLHRRQKKLIDISVMAAAEALTVLDLAEQFRAALERHDEVPGHDLEAAKVALAGARTRIERLQRELRDLKG
jgi:hypothetical protein